MIQQFNCFSLVQGVPAQYDFTQCNPRYSTLEIVLNSTNSSMWYGFLPFFSKKTGFLKVHIMNLVLVLSQYDFSIVQFHGRPEFVLSRDPLLLAGPSTLHISLGILQASNRQKQCNFNAEDLPNQFIGILPIYIKIIAYHRY